MKTFNTNLSSRSSFLEQTRANLHSSSDKYVNAMRSLLINNIKSESLNMDYPIYLIKDEMENRNKSNYVEVEYNDMEEKFNYDSDSGLFSSINNKVLLRGQIGNILKDNTIRKTMGKFIEQNKIPKFNKERILEIYTENANINIGKPKKEKLNINSYTPGQTAKLYIDYLFTEEIENNINNVVLFDQPENDVDKAFIYSELITRFNQTKNNVQIIITSHEPLLIINGDSNMIIQAEKINNKIVYTSLKLESYNDDGTIAKHISKYIDGHVNAIKDRYEIYTGGL